MNREAIFEGFRLSGEHKILWSASSCEEWLSAVVYCPHIRIYFMRLITIIMTLLATSVSVLLLQGLAVLTLSVALSLLAIDIESFIGPARFDGFHDSSPAG
jgi:hypothetical protein